MIGFQLRSGGVNRAQGMFECDVAEFVGQYGTSAKGGCGGHHFVKSGVDDDQVTLFSWCDSGGENAVGTDKKDLQGCEVLERGTGEGLEENLDTAQSRGIFQYPLVFVQLENFFVKLVQKTCLKKHLNYSFDRGMRLKGDKIVGKTFPQRVLIGGAGRMELMGLRFTLLWTIFVFLWPFLGEAGRRNAYMIQLYGDKARVSAPHQYHPRAHLLIENRTLASVSGRIENLAGEVKKYISVLPNRIHSLPLIGKKGERLFFVSLSPPLQAFELKIGKPTYEIPPQR